MIYLRSIYNQKTIMTIFICLNVNGRILSIMLGYIEL